MFSKANIISTILTTIWGVAGGYLLWGIIGDPYLETQLGSATGVMKEMPDMMYLGIGCLVQGFVFSYIYSKWANGAYSAASGLNFGIWLGVLVGIAGGLISFATSDILNITGTMVNALIYIVFFAVMGVLAGIVYNKAK